MDIDFTGDAKIDKACREGNEAGKVGKAKPPMKYATDELLLCSWHIGNRQGSAMRPTDTSSSMEAQ